MENTHSVEPIEWKAKWPDFECLRDLVYSGNIEFPKLENSMETILETTLDNYPEVFRKNPIDHLFYQLATVKESSGVTVLKGDGTTDDIFRTIVLGCALIQEEDIYEYLITHRIGYMDNNKAALGVVGRLTGSKSTSGGLSTQGRGIGVVARGR